MLKRKITINKKAKNWQDRYPLVSVQWFDICSDSSWQSISAAQAAKLPVCVTKGHLLSSLKVLQEYLVTIQRKMMGQLMRLVILQSYLIQSLKA